MTKTTTLIASCCLALLATPVVIFACDKDKSAGCTESQRTVLKVNSDKASSCGKAKGSVANVLTAAAGDCESGCPKQRTVNFLMRSLKGGCGDSCASKSDVVAALRTMATYEKDIVCEKSVDALAGVANVRTVGSGTVATGCVSDKKTVARAPLSDCAGKAKVITAGQGSGCCPSKAKKGDTQVVNANVTTTTAGTCDASSKYVAYGCDKSDRIARAAAKAYIAMMSELKDMNGADSCSLEAAQQVFATVMADMKRDSKTEVAAVSFGAVSEKSCEEACSEACEKACIKKSGIGCSSKK